MGHLKQSRLSTKSISNNGVGARSRFLLREVEIRRASLLPRILALRKSGKSQRSPASSSVEHLEIVRKSIHEEIVLRVYLGEHTRKQGDTALGKYKASSF